MTTASSPLHPLLKRLPASLLKLNHIPQLGYAPDFPWKEFASKLTSHLQIPAFEFTHATPHLTAASDVLENLTDKVICFNVSFPVLAGKASWVIPEVSLRQIMAYLLTKETQNFYEIDQSFFEGFNTFLAYEILYIYNQLSFDKGLDPHIEITSHLEVEDSICQEISFTLDEKVFVSRLVIPQSFLQGWRARFSKGNAPTNELDHSTLVPIHLVGGSIDLMYSQWKKIEPGDFLLLDQCHIDPTTRQGTIHLTLQNMPIFQASFQPGSINILEQSVFHEVNPHMPKKENPKDEDLFEDDDTDFEDFNFDEDDFEDDDFEDEEEEDEDEDDEEEEHLDEELEDNGNQSFKPKSPKENKAAEQEEISETTPTELAPKEAIKKVEDIPLSISIELGKIELSIQRLLELQPGNLLEIDLHPENTVDLVLHGRAVGKAELLQIGDNLGVRILEIG